MADYKADMDSRRLFLRRCDQVAALMSFESEGDLIDLGGRLRQLMFDGSASLVDKVNINKIQLRFTVGILCADPENVPPGLALMLLHDGLDPETAPPGKSCVELSREEFSKHLAAFVDGRFLTVRDLVRYAALVAGGVHHDSAPREEFRSLFDRSHHIRIGGLPLGIRDLMAVGRVTLKGLAPLIEDVRRQLDEPIIATDEPIPLPDKSASQDDETEDAEASPRPTPHE